MNDLRATRLILSIVAVAVLVAACAAGASPASRPPASPPPSADPSGDPPTDLPITAPPVGGDPNQGFQGKDVVPRPGQIDVHPVPADSLGATVDGNTIVVTAIWTTGVEPCHILDSVVVDRDDAGWTITLREGRGPEEVACIAIAEQHRTVFEIPDVPAGTYRIVDQGGLAAPVEVTVG